MRPKGAGEGWGGGNLDFVVSRSPNGWRAYYLYAPGQCRLVDHSLATTGCDQSIWRTGSTYNTLAGFRGRESMVDGPVVGIVMGSDSDWDVMQHAAKQLENLNVPFEARVVSAHRTPDEMFAYAETAASRGLRCIIAGAGGAAHLPGMLAAKTTLPVLGVPVPSKYLKGLDSLLSIVQMPKGVPVATFAIGEAGAANAGLFAAALLAVTDPQIAARLAAFRGSQEAAVRAMRLPPAKP